MVTVSAARQQEDKFPWWLKVFNLAGSQAARLWGTGFYATVAVCCDKYFFASVMSEGQIHPFILKMALTQFT